jgi:hypothetical protein
MERLRTHVKKCLKVLSPFCFRTVVEQEDADSRLGFKNIIISMITHSEAVDEHSHLDRA